jgi:hypothetical protein
MSIVNAGLQLFAAEPVPVLAGGAVAVVNAGLQLFAAFGVVVTTPQATAIGFFVSTVIGIAAVIARARVTPTAGIASAVASISDSLDQGELAEVSSSLARLQRKVGGASAGAPLAALPPDA